MVCSHVMTPRVFPVLTICDGVAVKTRKFSSSIYLGDPVNTVRLWSEMCVDEIVCLDISEYRQTADQNLKGISAIVNESFVPLSYGGGIKSVAFAEKLFGLGIEKVVIGWEGPDSLLLIEEIALQFGNQAVACCIDYSYSDFAINSLQIRGKRVVVRADKVLDVVSQLSYARAGEIIVQCVDRDGEQCGYDLQILSEIQGAVSTPLVLLGGAGSLSDVHAVHELGISAAASSLYVLRGKSYQVLIGNPFLDLDVVQP